MHILIDYTPAVRQQAGIGRLTRGLVEHLPRAEPEHRIWLWSNGRPRPDLRHVHGNPIWYSPLRERDMVRLWHRAGCPLPRVEWCTPVKPHIFHATDFVLPPSGAPCQILTVHDLSFRRFPDTAAASLARYLHRVVPRSVRRADHLIADSHSTARDLQEFWSVPEHRISVVPGAVDHALFRPVQERSVLASVRRKYGIGDRPFILGVSTLQPRKNFARLIRAFRVLADRHPGLMLVIAGGRGWRSQGIFDAVAETGLEKQVLFPGFVADGDLPALYSASECFAYPSLYEGFGLPILEAMACGVPVLTGLNSSLAEAGGAGALYVDERDENAIAAGLEYLLEDSSLRRELRRNGFRHAAGFTFERSARMLWQAYHRAWARTRNAETGRTRPPGC